MQYRFLSVLLTVLALSVPAFSQAVATGAITGRAEDTSGALIPGVEVTINSPAMIGGSRMSITDERGAYRFTLLPAPGVYTVTFSLPGFKTLNVEGVNVPAGTTMTINGTLEVATVAETITVTSQAPTIDLEEATTTINWGVQLLDDLPYGRSVRGLGRLIPGQATSQFDVGGNTSGGSTGFGSTLFGRPSREDITFDGNTWYSIFGDYGAYSEIQIETAAKGAEAIGPGAQVNYVIKSGGNELHGAFLTAYQNDSFQSDNINQGLLDRGLRPSANKFTRFWDLNGDVGGPIIRDKFWFYGSWGYQFTGTLVPGFIDLQTGEQVEYTTELDFATVKLTYQLNDAMKLETTTHASRKQTPYREASSVVPREATQNQNSGAAAGPGLKWTWIISPTMTLDAAIQRGGYWWPSTSQSTAIRRIDLTTSQTRGDWGYIYRRPIRWQWPVNWSWFTNIGGKSNEIKSGYLPHWNERLNEFAGYPNQQIYRYRSTSAEADAGQYFLRPHSVEVYDYPTTERYGNGYSSWFFNDKLTWNDHLTFNVGLRYERFTSWLPEQGNTGTGPFATRNLYPRRGKEEFNTYESWVPRLSMVYDVTGEGTFALKFSYGRYADQSGGAGVASVDARRVNPAERTRWRYGNWDGSIPYIPVPDNLTSISGGGLTSVRQLDPNLATPIMDEYTAGVEMGLGRDYVLRFNVIRKMDSGGHKIVNRALPFDAYTDVRYGVDPGRDNITGTSDDGVVEVWSVPRTYPSFGQIDEIYTEFDENEGRDIYTAYDFAFNKQFADGWTMTASYTGSFAKSRDADPQNPNDLLYSFAQQYPEWHHSIKLNGLYELPYGIRFSSTFQSQSGQYYGRRVRIQNALGASITVPVENQVGRFDTVRIWDNRFSKTIEINDQHSFEAMFDIFNTLNSAAVLRHETLHGPNYQKPLATSAIDAAAASPILAPRIFRVGMRWRF